MQIFPRKAGFPLANFLARSDLFPFSVSHYITSARRFFAACMFLYRFQTFVHVCDYSLNTHDYSLIGINLLVGYHVSCVLIGYATSRLLEVAY